MSKPLKRSFLALIGVGICVLLLMVGVQESAAAAGELVLFGGSAFALIWTLPKLHRYN